MCQLYLVCIKFLVPVPKVVKRLCHHLEKRTLRRNYSRLNISAQQNEHYPVFLPESQCPPQIVLPDHMLAYPLFPRIER